MTEQPKCEECKWYYPNVGGSHPICGNIDTTYFNAEYNRMEDPEGQDWACGPTGKLFEAKEEKP